MADRESFIACPCCGCHVRGHELDCPHCGSRMRAREGAMARTTAAILLGVTAATATASALPGCAYGVACTGGPEDPCGAADGGGGSGGSGGGSADGGTD